jgi:hypothetical protein
VTQLLAGTNLAESFQSLGYDQAAWTNAPVPASFHKICPGGSASMVTMDDDLATLTREELIAEVVRLRAGIRAHRDSTGHELCWHHPQLWSLLPEPIPKDLTVPDWPQFLRGCIRYREALDRELPDAPRTDAEFDESSQST